MRIRVLLRAVTLVAVAGLVAAAYGGGKSSTSTTAPPTTGTPTPTQVPTKGGSIVIGAEQWPGCVNPITSCSSATWTWYSVLGHVLPYAMVLDLSGNIGQWCKDVQPFSQFTYDPQKAVQIMESDGYDCSGVPNSPCTKGGKPLSVEYSTESTNTRRTTTQQLLQEKAKPAGFGFNIKNYEAGELFGDVGPHGTFTMADYATGGSVDPSVTSSFACENIPTSKNSFSGGNWNHWCDTQATSSMHQSDQQLDVSQRLKLHDQIYQLEAQDFLSLPLYVLPNVGAWPADKIGGPIDAYIPSNLGMFWNINEWYLIHS